MSTTTTSSRGRFSRSRPGSRSRTRAWIRAELTDLRAPGGRIIRCRLDRVALTRSRLRSLNLTDVILHGVEASGGDWTGGRLRRVVFDGCRLAGLQLAEIEADDVVFRDCRLELANFRGARLRTVTFEGCVLDEADFGAVTMREVRFDGCELRRTEWEAAKLARVDFRGSELEPAGDVAGLRGAIIDPVQLAGLAPLLAHAAGIVVKDG